MTWPPSLLAALTLQSWTRYVVVVLPDGALPGGSPPATGVAVGTAVGTAVGIVTVGIMAVGIAVGMAPLTTPAAIGTSEPIKRGAGCEGAVGGGAGSLSQPVRSIGSGTAVPGIGCPGVGSAIPSVAEIGCTKIAAVGTYSTP